MSDKIELNEEALSDAVGGVAGQFVKILTDTDGMIAAMAQNAEQDNLVNSTKINGDQTAIIGSTGSVGNHAVETKHQ